MIQGQVQFQAIDFEIDSTKQSQEYKVIAQLILN